VKHLENIFLDWNLKKKVIPPWLSIGSPQAEWCYLFIFKAIYLVVGISI
jgi:hypothetical protein